MPLHGLVVAAGHDELRTGAALGTDGAEDIDQFGALVLGCAGPAATSGPAPGDLGLLADPRIVYQESSIGMPAGSLVRIAASSVGASPYLKASMKNSFC